MLILVVDLVGEGSHVKVHRGGVGVLRLVPWSAAAAEVSSWIRQKKRRRKNKTPEGVRRRGGEGVVRPSFDYVGRWNVRAG